MPATTTATGNRIATLLSAAVLAPGAQAGAPLASAQTLPAASGSAATAGRYLAGRMMDDARRILRDVDSPPEIAARQALILLTFAQRLDESGAVAQTGTAATNAATPDLRILKMLAEAARAAGNPAIRKEALRKIIALDKGDLVAQVAYLDLLANANQTLEQRARIYQTALDSADLSPQIKSEMAVRLASVAEERGDGAAEKQFFQRAVALNDVNVAALRGLARLAGEDPRALPEHIAALAVLLTANPYQPDAWIELAHVCETCNLHGKAADYLMVSLEQMQLEGVQPSGEFYLEYGLELAIAGRRPDAFGIVNALGRLPDSPVTARAIASALAMGELPGVGTTGAAATRPEKVDVGERLQASLRDLTKAALAPDAPAADAAAALADAAGLALTCAEDAKPAAAWIDAYAKLVAPEDATLARLRAWQLYRDGKLDEARAAFTRILGDPLAQVGLARVSIDQNKKDEAARQLQDLWSAHPTGLLALQVTEAARRGAITLTDTRWTQQLRTATDRLPSNLLVAHRSPREMVLITAAYRKAAVGLGEPAMLSVRTTNATNRAIPVSPAGIAVSTLGFSATTRGLNPVALGMYAIEDTQRVYRLEAHSVLETTVRLDQGSLADVFERNPVRSFIIGITMATAPRLATDKEVVAGLGGQTIHLGDFERGGMAIGSAADFEKLRQDLATLTGEKLLIRIRMAEALLASLTPTGGAVTGATPPTENAKTGLTAALLPLAKADEPLVRATWIRSLPPGDIGDDLVGAAAALAADPEPLVRVYWAAWQSDRFSAAVADKKPALLKTLEDRTAQEQDASVKDWMEMLVTEAKMPAATAPAAPGTPSNTP